MMIISGEALDNTDSIRRIFLDRKRRYSLKDVVCLTGVTERQATAGVQSGQYVATGKAGAYRFDWSELAHMAMERWPLTIIHDALGLDAALALPRLLLLEEWRVRLPAY